MICIYKYAEFNGADFLRVKCRCQLVVRLKANKYYQEMFCYLSSTSTSWVSGLLDRLLVPDRFQTFNPWSRPLANSGLYSMLEVIVIVFVFVWSIICHHSRLCRTVVHDCLVDCLVRHPIAFGLTKPLVSVVDSLGLCHSIVLGLAEQMFSIGCLIVLSLSFGLLLNRSQSIGSFA